MKIKNLMGRVMFYGATIAFLNYFGLPLSTFTVSQILKKEAQDKRIQEVCKTDSSLEKIAHGIDVKSCDAPLLLKAAHAVTLKWLTIDYNKPWFGEKKRALEEGKAMCKYFSAFTYSNYLYLADKLGRPELKNKVRLCTGFVYDGKKVDGAHAWLQVHHNNKWNDYETLIDLVNREDEINFRTLKNLPVYEGCLLDNENYSYASFIQFDNDKLVNSTNLFYTIESGADLKSWVLPSIKKKFSVSVK